MRLSLLKRASSHTPVRWFSEDYDNSPGWSLHWRSSSTVPEQSSQRYSQFSDLSRRYRCGIYSCRTRTPRLAGLGDQLCAPTYKTPKASALTLSVTLTVASSTCDYDCHVHPVRNIVLEQVTHEGFRRLGCINVDEDVLSFL